jgi:hypothetical protein
MRSLALISVLAALLAGCDDGACGGDQCQAYAVSGGRVLDADGAPVAGARLQSFVGRVSQPCTLEGSLGSDNKLSGADGSYRLVLGGDGPRSDACGFIEVQAPTGSGMRDTLVGPLSFSLAYEPAIDSITIEIRLSR